MPNKAQPIDEIGPGKVMGRKTANKLIRFYNAFLNGEIKIGPNNQLFISDRNVIWQINPGGSSGGNASYRGEYSPDGNTEFNPGPFAFGDIVRVTPENLDSTTLGGTIIPGVYICAQANPGETDLPNHPLSPGGETGFWQLLSTYPMKTQECDGAGTQSTFFADQQEGN